MNIEKILTTKHQVCLAHKRNFPYTSVQSFLIMFGAALLIAFFIDSGPRYTSKIDSQTAIIFAATPFIFILLTLLQCFYQKTLYNSNIFVTRKGVSVPDLKTERDFFVTYSDIKALHIYYFPLTPLFAFGPRISTHFKIENTQGESSGVHIFNVDNFSVFKEHLSVHNVPFKHRISRWTFAYSALFIVCFTLAVYI